MNQFCEMAKETKQKNPLKSFLIPTIEEVSTFMKEKKPEWAKTFCDWYADKFINSYTASGWKLSAGRGGPVKDWRACFSNNWKTLKYKEDLDMLTTLTPKPKVVDEETLNFFNDVLTEYREGPGPVSKERLAGCYDWMKENKFIRLTAQQKEKAIEESKKDLLLGKATATKFVFDHLISNLLDFSYFFKEV